MDKEEKFEYQGQPLTKEEIIEMFHMPEYEMEVIFSEEPPSEDDILGMPLVLPNYTVYMCCDDNGEKYWVVAVENKNPVVEFSYEYIDDNLNKEIDDVSDLIVTEPIKEKLRKAIEILKE